MRSNWSASWSTCSNISRCGLSHRRTPCPGARNAARRRSGAQPSTNRHWRRVSRRALAALIPPWGRRQCALCRRRVSGAHFRRGELGDTQRFIHSTRVLIHKLILFRASVYPKMRRMLPTVLLAFRDGPRTTVKRKPYAFWQAAQWISTGGWSPPPARTRRLSGSPSASRKLRSQLRSAAGSGRRYPAPDGAVDRCRLRPHPGCARFRGHRDRWLRHRRRVAGHPFPHRQPCAARRILSSSRRPAWFRSPLPRRESAALP